MTIYMSYRKRKLDLTEVIEKKSCFLFGPRQTGKTSLIHEELKPDLYYNLLESDTFLRLNQSPQRLRENVSKKGQLVVIDEVQKLPLLLDEVHNLIESQQTRFLLTGSSARKLRRGGVNLLGGRARHRTLHPFVSSEIPDFNLIQALNWGLIPSIYYSDSPKEDIASYVGDYLQEEIAHEGLTRNIPAFSRFLEVAALSNGQMINFSEIANDAQVARTTVHEYFYILKDTLIAHELEPWKKSKKRKPVSTSKYYFFDNGVVRYLQHGSEILEKSKEMGAAFEQFIFHELKTFCDYKQAGDLCYWRSKSGFEVDFILNDTIAIEIKAKLNISTKDISGMKALQEEKLLKKYYIVSFETLPRQIKGIEILPWKIFLQRLWDQSL
jgi:uncharacterized protein